MGTYKGNAGHLMQHWTLCELLTAAKRRHTLEIRPETPNLPKPLIFDRRLSL